jgi:phosphate starvation-inducible PhoH-like protein
MFEQTINVERMEDLVGLFGTFDSNLRQLEAALRVAVVSRGSELKIQGDPEDVYKAVRVVNGLIGILARGEAVTDQNIQYVLGLVEDGEEEKLGELAQDVVCVTMKGKPIKPKTLGQKRYVESIANHTVTMGIGPAGTGKTYLAVAAAVTAFRQKRVSRIILTRPAVEAGEKLGFLPGDLQNKVDPYLRPLYDAMFDMLGGENYHKYVERGNIEVAPLAYMRGRTLDDSFIILDEAQNTTREQMKMFLTRLGFQSKIVITGDVTQIDLPKDRISGLKEVARVLKNVPDIAICELTARDVVRHALVQRIIRAYESFEEKKDKKNTALLRRKKP